MSVSNTIQITQATAGSSNWFRTPSIAVDAPYVFTGTLVSGDSVVIELSNDNGLDTSLSTDRSYSTGTTTQKSTSSSQTATSFSGSILGNWKYWRVTKTGSAGSAVVQLS